MGRIYMSYLNSGKEGYTWATLTALVLGAHDTWMTTREVADVIWGDPMTTPLDIRQQVNTCIDKLIEAGFVNFMKAPKDSWAKYTYILNEEGRKHFAPQPDFIASEHSDSKMFTRPARTKSKKVIRFSKKRHYQRRSA